MQLEPLVREGVAGSLTELAQRFVIANPNVTTMLVGYSTLDQLEQAAAAVEKGPLPQAAVGRIVELASTRRCTARAARTIAAGSIGMVKRGERREEGDVDRGQGDQRCGESSFRD